MVKINDSFINILQKTVPKVSICCIIFNTDFDMGRISLVSWLRMQTPMKRYFLEPSVLTICAGWSTYVLISKTCFQLTHFSWTVFIRVFHSSDYDEYYLSWCYDVLSSGSSLMLHVKVQPLFSGQTVKFNKQAVKASKKQTCLFA